MAIGANLEAELEQRARVAWRALQVLPAHWQLHAPTLVGCATQIAAC